MEANKTKKKKPKAFIILLVVLFVGIAAGVVFVMAGGIDALFGGKGLLGGGSPPVAYRAEGDVLILELDPLGDLEITDADNLRGYYAGAIGYAQANGMNTILYQGKTGIDVWWWDKHFPLNASVAAQSSTFSRLDPLDLLIDQAEGTGIQVWVGVDAFSLAGHTAEMKGKIAEIAEEYHVLYLPTTNKAYTDLLMESLEALPGSYGVDAVVFTGLENTARLDDDFSEGFKSFVLSLDSRWQAKGYPTRTFLWLSSDESALTAEDVRSLSTNVNGVLLAYSGEASYSETAETWRDLRVIAVEPAEEDNGQYLFTMAGLGGVQEALLARYPADKENAAWVGSLASTLRPADSTLPTGFEQPQALDITYPVDGRQLSWEGVYITGTSDPVQPLTMDGVTVDRERGGAFGIFVDLEVGDNVFVFKNGETTVEKTITRTDPDAGGGEGGGATTPATDETQSVPKGTVVRTTNEFTTAQTDPENFYSVNETFNKGATVIVQDSQQVTPGSALTWAYLLSSGDWLMASAVEVVEGTDGVSSFTGLRAEAGDGGEYIHFEGTGTPAAYISYGEDGRLSVTMYDTSFALPANFTSELVSGTMVTEDEETGAVVLSLITNNIWGYNIEYENGTTKLYLKKAPTLSDDPERPLAGVHVLLDPGHGESTPGTNYGAVGLAGDSGYPHEKDVNLVLAEATAYRLRQLGATVTLTRTDETNLTIYERHAMQTDLKPDYFISIHHDGLDGNMDLSDRDSLLSFYYHPYLRPPSKAFAQNLMDRISVATGRTETEARWGSLNYGVLRVTVCPSVLFEYGLIVHPNHYEGAISTDGIYAAALATAQAIVDTTPGYSYPE